MELTAGQAQSASSVEIKRNEVTHSQVIFASDSPMQNESAIDDMFTNDRYTPSLLTSHKAVLKVAEAIGMLKLEGTNPHLLNELIKIHATMTSCPVRFNENDKTIAKMKRWMIDLNGGYNKDDDSQPVPRHKMVIDLGYNVEAEVSPWQAMDDTGVIVNMPGYFRTSCGRFIVVHFKKLDSKVGRLNRQSPMPQRRMVQPVSKPILEPEV